MAESIGPELNVYVKTKLQKDQDISYKNVVTALDAAIKDDKLLKTLMQMVSPSLFAFPDVTEKAIKPLLNLIKFLGETKKDHKKLLRQLYAVLQMLLGPGHAGSTSKDNQGEIISSATLSRETMNCTWEMLIKPTGDLAQQRVALRVMAATVRSTRTSNMIDKKKYADHLAQTLSTILSKDFRIDSGHKDRRLFRSITQKSQTSSSGIHYLQTEALSAVRIALSQGGKQRLATKGFAMLDCENSLAARHALALAVDLAGKNIEAYKEGVGPHLEVNIQNYGKEGNLCPTSESSSGKPSVDDSPIRPLNLSDVFARVYLARGCGFVVHDEGIQESKSTIFWKALVILACNDTSDLVSNEAIRVILGAPPPKVKDLTAGGRHRKEFRVDDGSEAAEQGRRWTAWTAIVKEKPSPISGKEIDPHSTILSRIVERMRQAIQLGSQPAICGACRSAVELARARAYATSSTRENAHMIVKASDSIVPLQDDLMVLATSAWHNNAAQQSIALQALIWLQGTDGGPLTPPVLANILSQGNTWSREMLSDLLQTLFQRLVVEPDMAAYILDCVNAIVAGHPSKILPVEIVDFWSQSFERASKNMVLRAALQFLEAPSPPRVLGGTGSDLVSLAHATEAATSLRKLRRIATWWLGEAANFISDEYVEEEFTPILADAYGMSPSDIIATECMRNPLLATTVSHLQQSLLTASWSVRHAAAESLIKIAFKSGEPFRIQIYKLFKEVLSGVEDEVGMDPFGLIIVLNPAIDILDAMYSGQAVIEGCIKRWGGMLYDWPEAAAQSLHQRHEHLVRSVQRFCKVGADDPYYPLGSKSKSLLLGEEIYLEKQESLQVAETYSLGRSESDGASSSYEIEQNMFARKQPVEDKNQDVSPDFVGARITPDSPQTHTNRQAFNGYMIETNEWDRATEHSEESGTPSGQVHIRTQEDTGSWGQVDPHTADDQWANKTFTPRNSALSSVPSVGPIASPSSNTGIDASAVPPQNMPDSPRILREATSNANDIFEPRDASVMYDFRAELEGELSVTAGDVIVILDERDGGWYYARLGPNEGLVPCSYVAEPDM